MLRGGNRRTRTSHTLASTPIIVVSFGGCQGCDRPGWVRFRRFPGLSAVAMGSFSNGHRSSRRRIDWPIGRAGFVFIGGSPARQPAHPAGRFVSTLSQRGSSPCQAIGQGRCVEPSVEDRGWSTFWPSDPLDETPSPARSLGWATIVRIAKDRVGDKQPTVMKPGTRWGKRKRDPSVLGMIWSDRRDRSIDVGNSGRRGESRDSSLSALAILERCKSTFRNPGMARLRPSRVTDRLAGEAPPSQNRAGRFGVEIGR